AREVAKRVYDEGGDRWAVPGKAAFHAHAGPVLAAALAHRSREGIEAALAPARFDKADGYAEVKLYPTSEVNDFGDQEDRWYITITQYGPKAKNSVQTPSVLVSGWELFPDEAELVLERVGPGGAPPPV